MVAQNMVRTHEGKEVFSDKKDCSRSNQTPLTYRKKHRLLHTCAPISVLPSNISTMTIRKKKNTIKIDDIYLAIKSPV